MRPKKVVFLGPAHPLRGGIAATNERLAIEFQSQGSEVVMFNFSLQYPKILFPGKTQLSSSEAPKNLKIHSVLNSINPFSWYRVGKMIAKEKPDLIITRFWIPFLGMALGKTLRVAKRRHNAKVVCIVDNMIPHESRKGDKFLTRYFVKSIDAFIAMSNQVLEDINTFDMVKPRAFSPHPIFDNYGDVISKEQAIAKLNLDVNYKYILFFGLVRAYKGLDLMLKAMSDPRIKDLNLKLIVAGEYYEKEEKYDQLIAELGVKDQVIKFNKFIPNEEVAAFFCASDMVCQPYKHATQSGVTQIAYHFEVPMLVTNVGGLPEIVPHQKVGYVVEQNPSEIADSLIDFYENDRYQSFSEGVKDEKQKYSWDKMVIAINNLFKNL